MNPEPIVTTSPFPKKAQQNQMVIIALIVLGAIVLLGMMMVAYNIGQRNGERDGFAPTVTPTRSPDETGILPSATSTPTMTPTVSTQPEVKFAEQVVDFSWIEPYQDTKLKLKYTINVPVNSKIKTEAIYNGIGVTSTITFDTGINLVNTYVGDGPGRRVVVKKKDIATIGILKSNERLFRAVIEDKYHYFTAVSSKCGDALDESVGADEICVLSGLKFAESVEFEIESFGIGYIDISHSLLPAAELVKFDKAMLSLKK